MQAIWVYKPRIIKLPDIINKTDKIQGETAAKGIKGNFIETTKSTSWFRLDKTLKAR